MAVFEPPADQLTCADQCAHQVVMQLALRPRLGLMGPDQGSLQNDSPCAGTGVEITRLGLVGEGWEARRRMKKRLENFGRTCNYAVRVLARSFQDLL